VSSHEIPPFSSFEQGEQRGFHTKRSDMNKEYTAVIKQGGEWWIGWIEEVPGVNCQEATREELIESLRVTLREDALSAPGEQVR